MDPTCLTIIVGRILRKEGQGVSEMGKLFLSLKQLSKEMIHIQILRRTGQMPHHSACPST